MQKIIIYILILFALFFWTVSSNAQAPTPQLIPGIDCGVPLTASAALNNKCCYYSPMKIQIPKPSIPGIDLIVKAIESGINSLFNPVLDPLNRTVQQTIQPCIEGTPSTPGDPGNSNCKCIRPTEAPLKAILDLCKNVSSSERTDCENCLTGVGGSVGVWSGLGCVKANVNTFIQETLLGWGVGLAGIIALLCIIYSALMMQTSSGNPERIKKAQEMLTSCIMGLMLIIFSVFILKIIGVDILRIPGFN